MSIQSTLHKVSDKQNAVDSSTELSDIDAARGGDLSAYQRLYHRYLPRVYALCYRLTGETSLAEDATQEVFIQLWRKLDNFNGQSRFSTWLHSVSANVTISYMRKQKGWFRRMFNIDDNEEAIPVAPDPASNIDLETLVVQLPERARMVFVLHAIEGYRHEDIATMLGIAEGSSKAQFHRAKQLMKAAMGDTNE